MSKIFYDHLIVIEEVIAVLGRHNLNKRERAEFLSLIDQTLHHQILDEILTLLPKSRHAEFLSMFHKRPDDPLLLTFLREHSGVSIDKAIMKRADKTKKDLIEIINKSQAE